MPGDDWQREIRNAVRAADVVLVCLSNSSTTKGGYVQKEIKYALDIADERVEGSIFIIKVRLENCVVPERLRQWQSLDLSRPMGTRDLLKGYLHKAPNAYFNLYKFEQLQGAVRKSLLDHT